MVKETTSIFQNVAEIFFTISIFKITDFLKQMQCKLILTYFTPFLVPIGKQRENSKKSPQDSEK